MIVIATIYADTGSTPVKVRNLSASGALIEGPVLPLPRTQVRLSRGSLSLVGDIIWQKDGRAGLRFETAVSVADWLPHGRAISAQQRIDEIVQQVKAANNGVLPGPSLDYPPSQFAKLSATDLTRLGSRLIDQSQKMTVATMQMADMKVWAHRRDLKLSSLQVTKIVLGLLGCNQVPAHLQGYMCSGQVGLAQPKPNSTEITYVGRLARHDCLKGNHAGLDVLMGRPQWPTGAGPTPSFPLCCVSDA